MPPITLAEMMSESNKQRKLAEALDREYQSNYSGHAGFHWGPDIARGLRKDFLSKEGRRYESMKRMRISNDVNETMDNDHHLNIFIIIWDLLYFLFWGNIRKRVFEPSYEELHEDYLLACQKCKTKWVRRCLALIFIIRTIFLVFHCIVTAIYATLGDRVKAFLPERWRQLWPGGRG